MNYRKLIRNLRKGTHEKLNPVGKEVFKRIKEGRRDGDKEINADQRNK